MRALNAWFCNRVNDLFAEYLKNVGGDDDDGLDAWTARMIRAIYEDWKDEKLTDAEFAHLVDNIMCY
jgi:hypothetical protein